LKNTWWKSCECSVHKEKNVFENDQLSRHNLRFLNGQRKSFSKFIAWKNMSKTSIHNFIKVQYDFHLFRQHWSMNKIIHNNLHSLIDQSGKEFNHCPSTKTFRANRDVRLCQAKNIQF
jgi:hypothetical protein